MLRFLKNLFIVLFFLVLLIGATSTVFLTWGYYYITRDLPELFSANDYRPPVVSSVYAEDGTLIGEFWKEKRYPVKLHEIPEKVRDAFIAAEDASFYKHPGLDPISIIRAFVANMRTGHASQGGSTITQQVVKNLLLSPEKKIARKIKEAILSYQIEKRLSKDEILEIYFNQIFFGNQAYGVKAASRAYFRKELDQLDLAEASMLAGLPKAPSKYSPLKNFARAKRRQGYVLDQMVKAGFVTQSDADKADAEKLTIQRESARKIFRAPYYVDEVQRIMLENWKDYDLESDGLRIDTALKLDANEMAQAALRKGLKTVDKRRGWRGPIAAVPEANHDSFMNMFRGKIPRQAMEGEICPAMVMQIPKGSAVVRVDLGYAQATVDLNAPGWAKRFRDRQDNVSGGRPQDVLKAGDVIEVSLARAESTDPKTKAVQARDIYSLDQTPDIEGAIDILDPNTGKVVALIGGYSYERSVFNRVTQSFRQPGSSFKPIVYLSAVDGFGYTPSTIVHDEPRTYRVGDQAWTPGNFDEKYQGSITLRTALEKSRNLVSAEIVSKIGVDPVIRYAKRLGIESPIGKHLSISLGSSEVTLLELSRAYGVFAAKGLLFNSVFITRITDRNGKVIYDYEAEKLNSARQAISENSAFIMANMMKGVVDRGTATVVRSIGRPVAGKTGTSNNCMDTWFIGYTPEWVAGIWAGFDQKKEIGKKETGGKVSAPIWLDLMKGFLESQDKVRHARLIDDARKEAEDLGIQYVDPDPIAPADFVPPEGVEGVWVDRPSGRPVSEESPGAFLEYFVKGTGPEEEREESKEAASYLESPDL